MAAQPLSTGNADRIQQRIREGAFREATSLCAREHGAAVGRFCMALLGSQGEAEEVAQETLIAAHRAMASYRGDGSVRSWLFGIARRMCARRIETRVRRERKLRLVHDAGSGDVPEDAVERQQRATLVRNALEDLKPSERDVVLLRYEAGLSYREIASACGIDEAAARKRASRALHRLRTALKDQL
ncbi:MAG: sigma-70 family RNA polymerase sigma factor [Myxococcota bacterium]